MSKVLACRPRCVRVNRTRCGCCSFCREQGFDGVQILGIDLSAPDAYGKVISFLQVCMQRAHYIVVPVGFDDDMPLPQDSIGKARMPPPPVLPRQYLTHTSLVILNIPMDAETPGGRLLRPQVRNLQI
jgi:hypothetical protein